MDWERLSDQLGPQAAAYHRERYTFPQPLTPEQMPRFPDAEIEYSNGQFRRLYAEDYGREEWRLRHYVKQAEKGDDATGTL